MTNARTLSKKSKPKNRRDGVFHILWKFLISWKICKGRVKKKSVRKNSKACAGNTCTPCEGLAAPSTPHRASSLFKRGRL